MTALVAKTVETLGNLNVMVANAGIAQVKPLLEVTEEDWDRMLAINTRGIFNCYQAAAKQYIKQGTPGKIIGGASIVAFRPFPYLGHYSVSKFAVRGLTQVYFYKNVLKKYYWWLTRMIGMCYGMGKV